MGSYSYLVGTHFLKVSSLFTSYHINILEYNVVSRFNGPYSLIRLAFHLIDNVLCLRFSPPHKGRSVVTNNRRRAFLILCFAYLLNNSDFLGRLRLFDSCIILSLFLITIS